MGENGAIEIKKTGSRGGLLPPMLALQDRIAVLMTSEELKILSPEDGTSRVKKKLVLAGCGGAQSGCTLDRA